MFKLFIEQFAQNQKIKWGTILCLVIEMIKSGSIIYSLGLFTLIYGIFFSLCYFLLFRKPKSINKQKRRISEQYRTVKPKKKQLKRSESF